MQNDIFKAKLINYWRDIDKKIFFVFYNFILSWTFFFLFHLLFFSWRKIKQRRLFFLFQNTFFYITSNDDNGYYINAFNTSFLKKIIIPLFTISLISLALVPIFGIEVKGAKRWLDLYFFRLQPIELVKPFFILVTVNILTTTKLKILR